MRDITDDKVRAMQPRNGDPAVWEKQNEYNVYANNTASLQHALHTEYASALIEDMHIKDMTLNFHVLNNVMLRNVTFERCVLFGLPIVHGANYGVVFRDSLIDMCKIYGTVDDCVINDCIVDNTEISHSTIDTLHVRNTQCNITSRLTSIRAVTLEHSLINNAVVKQLNIGTLLMRATLCEQLCCDMVTVNSLQRAAATPALANAVDAVAMHNVHITHDDTREEKE